MFFDKEEMKVAEQLAWEMLDGLNHSDGYYDLKDFVYFYYKGIPILDPWMNEKSQNCLWPDHESKECVVEPISYYGEKTIEDYVVRLFLKNSDRVSHTMEGLQNCLNEHDRLMRYATTMPIEVYFAMSEVQVAEEHGSMCIEEPLPESKRIYFLIDDLPADLFVVKHRGWQKEAVFSKKNVKRVMDFLYPEGVNFDYKKLLNRINGDEVRLIGFGD